MAYSINKATILGKLGRDAETKFTTSGKAVTRFSVATDHSYKKGDEWVKETTWHNVILWNAEKLAPYLTKGAMVAVEGRIANRSYKGKDGETRYTSELVSENVVLCGGAKSDGGSDSGRAVASTPVDHAPVTDDDIPF